LTRQTTPSTAATERRPSVKVPKRGGQTILRQLTETELLDRRFRLKTNDESVVIPTIRNLTRHEARSLSVLVPGLTFQEDEFAKNTKPFRTLAAALSNQVPAELISEIPRSLDIVGDIAILETLPKLSEYEKIIAQGVMRFQPAVRAVFAKAGVVSGENRVRPLRHLAGEKRTETIHHEFGCAFKLDLSKVFFSPRLSTEHDRIARQVGTGESVVDMFAGIGPFSVLIAKSQSDVEVNAIDSNDMAVKFIRENVRLNRVSEKVNVYKGDAREVVKASLQRRATRVIMNHPSRSNEFFDAACSALRDSGGILHYYRFVGGRDWEAKIQSEFDHEVRRSGYRALGNRTVRQVREVGPMKWQVALDAHVVKE
jgi:tRNA (guanine37-N1)-methyltransferase